MSIRIATFNVENLFTRYRFKENFDPLTTSGFGINDLAFSIYNDDSKKITGKAIREVNADIICLQEVENMEILERFNSTYLASMRYKYRLVIDSHDPRHIDVAVLSRYIIKSAKTYRHERNKDNTTWLFSRDCLEVVFDIGGKELTLYNNHFKSMIKTRKDTKKRREEQVKRVADIITNKWGTSDKGNFAVLGDFNDYVDRDTSLTKLVTHSCLENILERIPEKDRWTHYWAGGDDYKQIDFILLSKALARKNNKQPVIMRKGLPFKAEKYTGDRFDDIGQNHPKASDHCPVFMDIELV